MPCPEPFALKLFEGILVPVKHVFVPSDGSSFGVPLNGTLAHASGPQRFVGASASNLPLSTAVCLLPNAGFLSVPFNADLGSTVTMSIVTTFIPLPSCAMFVATIAGSTFLSTGSNICGSYVVCGFDFTEFSLSSRVISPVFLISCTGFLGSTTNLPVLIKFLRSHLSKSSM